PTRVHVVVHVQRAAPLYHAVNGPLRHDEVVHGGPPIRDEAIAASVLSSRHPVQLQATYCPAPTSTPPNQPAHAPSLRRRATLPSVYITFSFSFQNPHPPSGGRKSSASPLQRLLITLPQHLRRVTSACRRVPQGLSPWSRIQHCCLQPVRAQEFHGVQY